MRNQWLIVNMMLRGNKFENTDLDIDQPKLDEKIDEFSEDLVSKFGKVVNEIKDMKDLLPAGKLSDP